MEANNVQRYKSNWIGDIGCGRTPCRYPINLKKKLYEPYIVKHFPLIC